MFFRKPKKNRASLIPRRACPYVDVFTEYGAGPIWLAKAAGDIRNPVEPSALPISVALANEFTAWQEEYDLTLDQKYPPDSIPPGEDFWKKGSDLAKRLAEELGNTYDVQYGHRIDS